MDLVLNLKKTLRVETYMEVADIGGSANHRKYVENIYMATALGFTMRSHQRGQAPLGSRGVRLEEERKGRGRGLAGKGS